MTDLFGGCTYPFSDTHMREWSYGRIHDMREMQDCRKRIVQLSKICLLYTSDAADSPKEGGKEPKTENQSGIPAVPNKVEDSGISTGEEVPTPVLREKTRQKRNGLQDYPEPLFDNNVVRERRQTYVSSDNYERVRILLSVIAPTVSISCYIDNILSAHLEQYRDELNALYSSRINLKPL